MYPSPPNPKTYKINVTQEHIAKGKPGNSSHCVLAEAIRDDFPVPMESLSIDAGLVSINLKSGWKISYKIPGRAIQMLTYVDDRAEAISTGDVAKAEELKQCIKPMKFNLDKRDCVGVVQIVRRGKQTRNPNRPKIKREKTVTRSCSNRRRHGLVALVPR